MTVIKELAPFIRRFRPHLRWMVLGMLSGAVALVAAVGLLSLSGWFLSATAFAGLTVIGAQTFNFFYPSVGVRLFAAARIFARYGERVINHEATLRILQTLRVWFYRRLEPPAPACLAKYRSGDILNRLVADIDALDHLYVRIISPAAGAFLIVLLLSIFLSLFDIRLCATASGLLMIAIVGGPAVAASFAMKSGRNLTRIGSTLRTQITESIQGMTDLIVFGGMEKQLKQIASCQRQMIAFQRHINQISGLSTALITLLTGCAVWITLFLGVTLVHSGHLNGEMLACLVLAVWASFEAAQPLALAFQHLGRTREAAGRIGEITSMPSLITFPQDSFLQSKVYSIEFENICFRYADESPLVLDGFHLKISHGSRTALIGETGCGKSTLVNLLARFWDPEKGCIRIGGRRLDEFAEQNLRRTLTIVSQQAHIFNTTLADNLRIAKPDATDAELFHALETVQLADFVRSLSDGLLTWLGESGQRLSGGQSRRVALARAVLHNAPIWILDEPTEGLDTITEQEVVHSLMQITEGRTLLSITHRLAGLNRMDQVALMEQGKIVACGTHRELKGSESKYRNMLSRIT
jgi:ATP-binding cassette subfamily C protein CydC